MTGAVFVHALVDALTDCRSCAGAKALLYDDTIFGLRREP